MKVIKLDEGTSPEILWDDVGIHGCDFRPHFDGHLYNLYTAAHPLKSKVDTEKQFKEIANKIAEWIIQNKSLFHSQDRFQIIVGWPTSVRATDRQCIKTGGPFEDIGHLARNRDSIEMRDGWHLSVFDNDTAG